MKSEFPHCLRKRTRMRLVLWVWGPGQLPMAKWRGTLAPGGDKPQARENPTSPYPLSGHWEPLSANKTGQWCLDKLACSMPFRTECQTLPTTDIGTTFHGYTARSSSALTGYYCLRLWAWACATRLYSHVPTPPSNIQVWVLSPVLQLT